MCVKSGKVERSGMGCWEWCLEWCLDGASVSGGSGLRFGNVCGEMGFGAGEGAWAHKKENPLSGIVSKIVRYSSDKFLIPIKYRNCNFFSVSYQVPVGGMTPDNRSCWFDG